MKKDLIFLINSLSSEVDNFNYAIFENKHDELIEKSVEIAENFAIGLVEWISVNGYNIDYFVGNERLSELLEIYKKTL